MKRRVRWLILKHAYVDRVRCERVNRLTRLDVLRLIDVPVTRVGDIPDLEVGEVLVDSRGTGSFQRPAENRSYDEGASLWI